MISTRVTVEFVDLQASTSYVDAGISISYIDLVATNIQLDKTMLYVRAFSDTLTLSDVFGAVIVVDMGSSVVNEGTPNGFAFAS